MKIKSAHPTFTEESVQLIANDVADILRSGRLILGKYTERFEAAFKSYVGTRYAVAVNSGTTAMQITLQYLGVKGSEVIIPTNTFLATANAAIYAGGVPSFADIEEQALGLCPQSLRKKIGPDTKGVILVHLAGFVSPHLETIQEICREHNLFLIEDCAHAHGASYKSMRAGALSFAGCFSFYPTKVMTTALGGMITTNDPQLDAYARSLRHHGQTDKSLDVLTRLGNDWLLDEVRSAIGFHQVQALEPGVVRRNELARCYADRLRRVKGVHLFPVPGHIRHAYYKYLVHLDESIPRDKLVERLNEKHDIEVGVLYYPPCHLQPIVQEMFKTKPGDLPVSEMILRREICLPMHLSMTEQDVDRIADALKRELEELRGKGPS